MIAFLFILIQCISVQGFEFTQKEGDLFIQTLQKSIPKFQDNLNYLQNADLLPPLWDEILNLDKSNFDLDDDGRLIVDAWDYRQRMSLYKYFIDNIHHCAWSSSHQCKYNLGNIIWGLPLQHGWQFSSGRLLTAANSTQLTTASWWADMNYYLSVIPYLGLMAANLSAPEISIAVNPDPSRFCSAVADCAELVAPWRDFFLLMNTTATNCSSLHTPTLMASPIVDRADFNLSFTMESLLSSLWHAHISSIDHALPLFNNELHTMGQAEVTFARSWAGLVDLIAECLFPCNNSITNLLQYGLPERLLTSQDQPPFIPDLPRLQNRAVVMIDAIYAMNVSSHGAVEKIWMKMMCTEEGRAMGRKILAVSFYRPLLMVEYAVELVEITVSLPKNTTCGVIKEEEEIKIDDDKVRHRQAASLLHR